MASDIVIRAATSADLQGVLDLWDEARSEHATTPDSIQVLERLVARDAGALLLAEAGDRLVGVLIAAWDGWRGNMYRLAVRPGHRREGVAGRLIAAGEESLRARGARRITALVAHEDEVAIATWRSAGYEIDPLIGRLVRNI